MRGESSVPCLVDTERETYGGEREGGKEKMEWGMKEVKEEGREKGI